MNYITIKIQLKPLFKYKELMCFIHFHIYYIHIISPLSIADLDTMNERNKNIYFIH